MPYIPNTHLEQQRMLDAIGIDDIDDLFEPIPEQLKLQRPLNIPGPLSEMDLAKFTKQISKRNINIDDYICFLGAGIYDHYIPATVPEIIGRSEFYTSYTPYQPELSQGNLQSIFEFQTLICRLTGMEVANASMYDGATALAEAAIMASSITGRNEWLISDCIHPAYRETMHTYAWATGCTIIEEGRAGIKTDIRKLYSRISKNTACVVIQNPNFFGTIEDITYAAELAHNNGALFIACVDLISLGLLKPPGQVDADICVGEGQSLGIHPSFGGPLLGFFSCKKKYIRQMPGRIVGATVDAVGKRGYALTLQTREQHIRRERATSNICTNEALNALAATVYLSTLGKSGLKHIAHLCLQKAHYAAESISDLPGYEMPFKASFIKEFVIKANKPVQEINRSLIKKNIIGGLDLGKFYPDLKDHMLLCVTEKRTVEEINSLVEGLST